MLFLFVTLGLLAFISATFGFLTTLRTRSVQSGLHFGAMFLLGVAWVLEHASVAGWAAMMLAVALEIAAWAKALTMIATGLASPPAPQESMPSTPAKNRNPATPPPEPTASSTPTVARPNLTLTTHALLRAPWHATPDVFLASLRRGGQRDARLSVDARDDRFHVEVGLIRLQLNHAPSPIARDLLEYAVSQTFDWPEAESVVRGHVAHVSFVTRCPDDVPRQNVIQTHCRAYAALAEFAAPIALLWPDAGRLIPTARLATLAGGRVQPADTCITFRTYPLEGTEAGRTLCDSVGLHAFNLPDLQLTTDGEPDEAVSRFLFQCAEDFFRNGCVLADGGVLSSPSGEAWSAHFRPARFPPTRRVIELLPGGGAT